MGAAGKPAFCGDLLNGKAGFYQQRFRVPQLQGQQIAVGGSSHLLFEQTGEILRVQGYICGGILNRGSLPEMFRQILDGFINAGGFSGRLHSQSGQNVIDICGQTVLIIFPAVHMVKNMIQQYGNFGFSAVADTVPGEKLTVQGGKRPLKVEPLEGHPAFRPVLVGTAAVKENGTAGRGGFLSAVIFHMEFPFLNIKEQENIREICRSLHLPGGHTGIDCPENGMI